MTFVSLPFAVFVLIGLALLGSGRSVAIRQWIWFTLDAIFLASMVQAPIQLVPLLAFAAIGYVAVCLADRFRLGWLVSAQVLLLVGLFAWLKRYPGFAALPALPFAFTLVGLSYIQFRILHVVIDVGQGALERPRPLPYVLYLFHFPALLSGPIHRYEHFAEQIAVQPAPMTWDEIESALARIVRGVLMVAVLGAMTSGFETSSAPLLQQALDRSATDAAALPFAIWVFALKSGVYLYNIFFNFAGSMEIAIPISLLMGVRLPENFNQPFLAAHFLDLWARWHITLSNWLKFYLFNYTMRYLAERHGTRANMPYLGVIAFFVTFLVIGVWHGPTPIFIGYGLLLAVGVSVNRLWQIRLPTILGKDGYRRLQKREWYRQMARAMALSYLAVCQGAFWFDTAMIARLATWRGVMIALAGWIGLSVFGAVLGAVWDRVASACNRLWSHGAHNRATVTPAGATPSAAPPRLRMGTAIAAAAAGCIVAAALTVQFSGALARSSSWRYAYIVGIVSMLLFSLIYCGGLFDRVRNDSAAPVPGTKRAVNRAALYNGGKILVVLTLCEMLADNIPALIYKAF